MVSTTFLLQFYNQLSLVIYILALCIMQMPINLTFMQVKVKTWIKIAEPTLISVLIKGESLFFQSLLKGNLCFSSFPPFKTHISCDQFLISMLGLGMSIGKKHHALMKAWSRVFDATEIKIVHVTMWQLTQQNYIITQFHTKKVR